MFIRTHILRKTHLHQRNTLSQSHVFQRRSVCTRALSHRVMSLGFKNNFCCDDSRKVITPLWHHNQLHYREVCAFYGREVGHQHPLPQCTTATGSIIAPVEGLIITVKHLNSLYTLKNCNTTKTAPYLYSPLHYDSLQKHLLLN